MLYLTLAHFIKICLSGYISWWSAIVQSKLNNIVNSLPVFLAKCPCMIPKSLLFLPPVNTEVW